MVAGGVGDVLAADDPSAYPSSIADLSEMPAPLLQVNGGSRNVMLRYSMLRYVMLRYVT